MPEQRFVRNELLAYVFDRRDADRSDDIHQIVNKFYNGDAVKNAKLELWKQYETTLPRFEERRNTGSRTVKEKEITDIINAVDLVDQAFSTDDELPVIFCAVKFCNVPTERFVLDVELRDRLVTLEIQMKEVLTSKTSTTTEDGTGAAPTTNQQQQHAAVGQQIQHTEGPNRQSDGEHHATDYADALKNPPLNPPPRPPPPPPKVTGNGNAGNGDWNVKERKKRKKKKPVYGTANDDIIQAGLRKQELFLFRIKKSVTVDQVKEYIIKKESVVLISAVQRSHADAASNSFHVVIHTMDTNQTEDPSFWPAGIGVRRYYPARRTHRASS